MSQVNASVKQWIERLGWLWIEGQLTQINVKPSWKMSYLTLRDTQENKSLQLTAATQMLRSMTTPLKDGDRVVVMGKPTYYDGRGTFAMWISEIRHVGEGELLAKIEQLRKTLAAEGLFDPERKKPLPYLPQQVGLITGRESTAERDVLSVAADRWPEVDFRVINTAVQGANAVQRSSRRYAHSTRMNRSMSSSSPAVVAPWKTCCLSRRKHCSVPSLKPPPRLSQLLAMSQTIPF